MSNRESSRTKRSTLEGRVQIAGRVVLYFDDFGRLECKDTYVNGMLKESVLCDGRTVYTVWHDQRIVFKRGPATRGTEVRFDLEAVPLSERTEGHVKKLPSMMFAGKVCEAYERTTTGGVIRYAGADHILMYCERNTNGRELGDEGGLGGSDEDHSPLEVPPSSRVTPSAKHISEMILRARTAAITVRVPVCYPAVFSLLSSLRAFSSTDF